MKLKMNKKGFTLVELIIVIVIIGILAAVLIPSLTSYIKKAKLNANYQEAMTIVGYMDAGIIEGYTYTEEVLGKVTVSSYADYLNCDMEDFVEEYSGSGFATGVSANVEKIENVYYLNYFNRNMTVQINLTDRTYTQKQ